MPDRRPSDLLIALGYTPETSRLYERLQPLAGRPIEEGAAELGMSVEELRARVAPLREFDVVILDQGVLRVRTPPEAMSAMLRISADRAREAHDRLVMLSQAMPYVAGTSVRAPAAHVEDERPLDGELITSGSMRQSMQAMAHETTGELMWLRPDRWTADYLQDLDLMAASGRASRAIYPARALTEAPDALATNAAHGEQIRLLPEVPFRLMVVAGELLVLPHPLGMEVSRRVVVRQSALVDLAAAYFELLWAQAAPLRGAHRPTETARRLLIQQLAQGAQDEQIARRLGVSLRTVRRRVAELMAELGAESRFQAGVEAAKRGWV